MRRKVKPAITRTNVRRGMNPKAPPMPDTGVLDPSAPPVPAAQRAPAHPTPDQGPMLGQTGRVAADRLNHTQAKAADAALALQVQVDGTEINRLQANSDLRGRRAQAGIDATRQRTQAVIDAQNPNAPPVQMTRGTAPPPPGVARDYSHYLDPIREQQAAREASMRDRIAATPKATPQDAQAALNAAENRQDRTQGITPSPIDSGNLNPDQTYFPSDPNRTDADGHILNPNFEANARNNQRLREQGQSAPSTTPTAPPPPGQGYPPASETPEQQATRERSLAHQMVVRNAMSRNSSMLERQNEALRNRGTDQQVGSQAYRTQRSIDNFDQRGLDAAHRAQLTLAQRGQELTANQQRAGGMRQERIAGQQVQAPPKSSPKSEADLIEAQRRMNELRFKHENDVHDRVVKERSQHASNAAAWVDRERKKIGNNLDPGYIDSKDDRDKRTATLNRINDAVQSNNIFWGTDQDMVDQGIENLPTGTEYVQIINGTPHLFRWVSQEDYDKVHKGG